MNIIGRGLIMQRRHVIRHGLMGELKGSMSFPVEFDIGYHVG